MPTTPWPRIEELFAAARALPPGERGGYLAAACGGDAALRAEVESLLAADDRAAGFLSQPAQPPLTDLADSRQGDGAPGGGPPPEPGAVPRRLGPYELRGEIGRGGMSEVWLAVRADDEFQRRVAVKLMRPGMDSADIQRRFRRERQILANLDHPNIARLYDGGTAPDGRPYFVMEHIDGTPIDADCERRGLDLRGRLALFSTVAAAVQHAHRSLVIHRDLKPGNILVDAAGNPKLLDFGIAKLLAPDAEGEATVTLARLFTPQYASPEQVRGELLTTATDVYSLGVLLFKLLVGRLPFAAGAGSLAELERERRQGAPRPSVAAPPALASRLAGDLDNIVLKALHPEPARRYLSVEQLGDDVQRFLDGLPVLAREDTFGYRAAKFLRRHRAPVAAGAAALLLVVGFAVVAGVQSLRLRRERDQAQRDRDRAEQVSSVLVHLFESADPLGAHKSDLTVREVLERDAARAVRQLADQPEVQARVMTVVGRAYISLGLYDRAEPLLAGALAIRRRTEGPRSLAAAESLDLLGSLAWSRDDLPRAERLIRQALDLRRQALGGEHPLVAASYENLGLVLQTRGDFRAASDLQTRALALRRKLLPADSLEIAESLSSLGNSLTRLGRFQPAEALLREALTIRRRRLGDDHTLTADTLTDLGNLLNEQGRYRETLPVVREVLALYTRTLGLENPRTATAMANLGVTLRQLRDFAAAEPLLREALRLRRKLVGPRHHWVSNSLYNLGTLQREAGDLHGAEATFRENLAVAEAVFAPAAWQIGLARTTLGDVRCAEGFTREGELLLRQGLALHRQALGDDHWRLYLPERALGRCLATSRRFAEAEPLLLRSYGRIRDRPDPGLRREAAEGFVGFYRSWGRREQAEVFARLLQETAPAANPARYPAATTTRRP